MAEDLTARLTDLHQRAENGRKLQLRAEADKESCEARIGALRDRLREEWGVATPEEARALLEDLETRIGDAMANAEQILTESGL